MLRGILALGVAARIALYAIVLCVGVVDVDQLITAHTGH